MLTPAPIGAPTGIGSTGFDRQLSDPNWRAFFDALQAQGVNKLATSAATGQNDPYSKLQTPMKAGDIRTGHQPGFFDVQDPNHLARQQLLDQLRAQDLNRGVNASR